MEKERTKFLSRVRCTDTCWIWKLSTDLQGYGVVMYENKTTRAMKVSWYLFRNEPIQKLVLTCKNPKCVNPDHINNIAQE